MAVRILYRDRDLIICEKPVGISSESPGLPDLVREQEGAAVYPVHRLDRMTGGACVLALTPSACTAVSRLFAGDLADKQYLAVIGGAPPEDEGSYFDLLYHDRRTNKTFVADKQRKGVKEALCRWQVLESIERPEGKMSLVRVRLHTGRTHQIRVQFASRKMPLIGDRRYGSRIKADGPALWCAYLGFHHPDGSPGRVEAFSAPPAIYPWTCFSDINGTVYTEYGPITEE